MPAWFIALQTLNVCANYKRLICHTYLSDRADTCMQQHCISACDFLTAARLKALNRRYAPGQHLKSLWMPVVLKVKAPCLLGDSWHFRREHAMQHQPEPHVVILPTPPPKVCAVPIHPLILLTCEYGDASKEVLSTHATE